MLCCAREREGLLMSWKPHSLYLTSAFGLTLLTLTACGESIVPQPDGEPCRWHVECDSGGCQ